MSTILFREIVFGPVHSRRLGVSLGVNLLPDDGKVCSFDCIYCECGYNADKRGKNGLPTREAVYNALDDKLKLMVEKGEKPDVITFAGNGEPTLHPQFEEMIEDTINGEDKESGMRNAISILKTRLSSEDYEKIKNILSPYVNFNNIKENV